MGLFDPGTRGYHRHRLAVTAVALVTLAGAAGAAAYTAHCAGQWAVVKGSRLARGDGGTPRAAGAAQQHDAAEE
jgi:hypothetical protein